MPHDTDFEDDDHAGIWMLVILVGLAVIPWVVITWAILQIT